jgi:pimeloyl-ACP methyl ester carboxylesterase
MIRVLVFAATMSLWTVQAHAQTSHTEELTIPSGDVMLAATFTRPAGCTRCPAAVLVHGSGPSRRAGLAAYARDLVSHGVAVLLYDKRGSGASTGDWTASSLDDLAEDVIHAMKALAARPGVDADRIGLWGVSQAGWVIPRAVAKGAKPAFLIMVTGGGASARDTELHAYRGAFARIGLERADVNRAEALLRQYFDYLKSGVGREELLQAIDAAKSEQWYQPLSLHRIMPGPMTRQKWAWVATYDPVDDIAKIAAPALILFAGNDAFTPTDLAMAGWDAGFKRGGNSRVTIKRFDKATHALNEGAHGSGALIPEYSTAVGEWLDTVGISRRR